MLERTIERILGWPERHPTLFRATALSTIRSLILFLLFLLTFVIVLTVPEAVLDERLNRDFYLERLSGFTRNWQSTQDSQRADDSEVRRSWFSRRMWDYRYLIYELHVDEPYDGDKEFDSQLAQWQSDWLRRKPSAIRLHYLYNPGFFWDIGVLLPLSLAALCMGFYTLLGHLSRFQQPTMEGRQPYIPGGAARAFLGCLLSPWTLATCLVGAVSVGYLALLPYAFIAIRGSLEIIRYCHPDDNTRSETFDHGQLVRSQRQWVPWLLLITAISSVTALVMVLLTFEGWKECITDATLAPYKPIQRIIKVFMYAIGVLATVWVMVTVVECARTSPGFTHLVKRSRLTLSEQAQVFDDLALNEIRILEYFGIFATLTILSFFQSVLFVGLRAGAETVVGVAILSGIVVVSLILLVLPIMYCWYLYVDAKRFNRWVDSFRARGRPTEKDEQELIRIQASRLPHLIKMVILRWRSLSSVLTIAGVFLYAGGIGGWF